MKTDEDNTKKSLERGPIVSSGSFTGLLSQDTLFHELRTPLNGIMGLSAQLIDHFDTFSKEEALQCLTLIRSCGDRLFSLMESATVACNSPNQPGEATRLTLRKLVDEVICLLSHTTDSNNKTLLSPRVVMKNKVSMDLPYMITDPERLHRILVNLLCNAIKFTEQGSIIVTAKYDSKTKFFTIAVEDTGIGIATIDQKKLFKPYVRVSPFKNRKDGMGLGLSIAKSLTEALGGELWMTSTEGVGSQFYFTIPQHHQYGKEINGEVVPGTLTDEAMAVHDALPCGKVDTYPIATRVEDPLPCMVKMPGRDARKVILSVDDDFVNQMVVEQLLQRSGYTVVKAMDGFEAIEYLQQAEKLPDLVLLDVMIPQMSGYDVCDRIRTLFPTSTLPVIMVSAKTGAENIVEGFAHHCNDYVSKPFHRGELIARINTQIHLADLWKIETENALNSQLLNKILPPHIAEQLKSGKTLIAQTHKDVTILFSDIVSFTDLASSIPTEQLVLLLNDLFSAFDALVDESGVYKVETIGDAYMVAAGHEEGQEDHAEKIIKFGQKMLKAVESFQTFDGRKIQIRVGVHSGPAFTGVVGTKNPRFCFFGDTVNVASRMESHGVPDHIHISSATHCKLSNVLDIDFEARGEIKVKGKGYMETFLVYDKGDPNNPLLTQQSVKNYATAESYPPAPEQFNIKRNPTGCQGNMATTENTSNALIGVPQAESLSSCLGCTMTDLLVQKLRTELETKRKDLALATHTIGLLQERCKALAMIGIPESP